MRLTAPERLPRFNNWASHWPGMVGEARFSIAVVIVLALAAIPIAPGAAATATNLVPNPSFEMKSSATALLPDSWTARPLGLGAAARSPLQAADGGFSLAFVGAPRATSSEVMWVRSQLVTFPPECPTTGTFSFQADILEGGLQGAVEYYRADGMWLRSDLVPASTNAGWTTYSRAFESPPGTAKVAFTFAVTSILGVTAHLDDVRYTLGSSAFRFCEDWEDGTNGWWMESGSGASKDCTRATDGTCSLKLANPHCCGEPYVRVSKNTSIPILASQTFTFDFQGSSTGGDRDALIQLRLGTTDLNVQMAEGPMSSNNGLNIISWPSGAKTSTLTWPNANTWYRAVVTIDGSSQVASVALQDLQGNVLGSSTTVPFTGTTLQGVSVQQVMWSSSTTTHHVDRLRLT